MFLLFGIGSSEKIIDVVSFVCGFCGATAPQNVIKSSNRFTVFFIPLFSFSTRYRNECTNCGAQTALTSAQARHSIDWARSH